ncbi:cGMP-dependent protein kinase [Aureococcus anophagefferens]|nr:cGMP-dependent protein kinase [Aureococcus anophagefferens]
MPQRTAREQRKVDRKVAKRAEEAAECETRKKRYDDFKNSDAAPGPHRDKKLKKLHDDWYDYYAATDNGKRQIKREEQNSLSNNLYKKLEAARADDTLRPTTKKQKVDELAARAAAAKAKTHAAEENARNDAKRQKVIDLREDARAVAADASLVPSTPKRKLSALAKQVAAAEEDTHEAQMGRQRRAAYATYQELADELAVLLDDEDADDAAVEDLAERVECAWLKTGAGTMTDARRRVADDRATLLEARGGEAYASTAAAKAALDEVLEEGKRRLDAWCEENPDVAFAVAVTDLGNEAAEATDIGTRATTKRYVGTADDVPLVAIPLVTSDKAWEASALEARLIWYAVRKYGDRILNTYLGAGLFSQDNAVGSVFIAAMTTAQPLAVRSPIRAPAKEPALPPSKTARGPRPAYDAAADRTVVLVRDPGEYHVLRTYDGFLTTAWWINADTGVSHSMDEPHVTRIKARIALDKAKDAKMNQKHRPLTLAPPGTPCPWPLQVAEPAAKRRRVPPPRAAKRDDVKYV